MWCRGVGGEIAGGSVLNVVRTWRDALSDFVLSVVPPARVFFCSLKNMRKVITKGLSPFWPL
jgi:hypothetical protein